VGAQAA
jgi:hypothetical protein